MLKPTIFFSHSSLDKEYISKLRDMILKATSKTVDIFQSSDGESIPFGNNWIHKVEESLKKTKIMLVFVSPKSIMSSWLYFESGFAYAKNVKVIPIGICGVDIGKLKPPLNLLQGFNISNAEGINNILTILNKEFDCSFEESYVQKDYDDLSVLDESESSTRVQSMDSIDYIQFGFPRKFSSSEKRKEFTIKNEPFKIIEEYLKVKGVTYNHSETFKIHTHGMLITELSDSRKVDAILVQIDPYSFSYNEELINGLCDTLYGEKKLNKFWANIIFKNAVELETTDFKVSSKLHRSGFDMSELNGKFYQFDSIDFTLEGRPDRSQFPGIDKDHLRVIFDAGKLDVRKIFDLVSRLIRSKVIRMKDIF